MEGGVVLTVGHSGHSAERLHRLIRTHGGTVVVDVRSVPWSRHHPQHSRREMEPALEAAGLSYVFLGHRLGGRPDDESMYDPDGHVRYDQLARTEGFTAGVEQVTDLARDGVPVLLCAEEDPTGCHRRLLVGRVLAARSASVVHVRGDSSAQPDGQVAEQLALFDGWRSARPVRLPAARGRP